MTPLMIVFLCLLYPISVAILVRPIAGHIAYKKVAVWLTEKELAKPNDHYYSDAYKPSPDWRDAYFVATWCALAWPVMLLVLIGTPLKIGSERAVMAHNKSVAQKRRIAELEAELESALS